MKHHDAIRKCMFELSGLQPTELSLPANSLQCSGSEDEIRHLEKNLHTVNKHISISGKKSPFDLYIHHDVVTDARYSNRTITLPSGCNLENMTAATRLIMALTAPHQIKTNLVDLARHFFYMRNGYHTFINSLYDEDQIPKALAEVRIHMDRYSLIEEIINHLPGKESSTVGPRGIIPACVDLQDSDVYTLQDLQVEIRRQKNMMDKESAPCQESRNTLMRWLKMIFSFDSLKSAVEGSLHALKGGGLEYYIVSNNQHLSYSPIFLHKWIREFIFHCGMNARKYADLDEPKRPIRVEWLVDCAKKQGRLLLRDTGYTQIKTPSVFLQKNECAKQSTGFGIQTLLGTLGSDGIQLEIRTPSFQCDLSTPDRLDSSVMLRHTIALIGDQVQKLKDLVDNSALKFISDVPVGTIPDFAVLSDPTQPYNSACGVMYVSSAEQVDKAKRFLEKIKGVELSITIPVINPDERY